MSKKKLGKLLVMVIIGQIFFVIILGSLMWGRFFKAQVSDGIKVAQEVSPGCDRDGVCEKSHGENIINCAEDCISTTSILGAPGGQWNQSVKTLTIWGLKVAELTSNSARIEWSTDFEGICELEWGLTQDYEKEKLTEIEAVKSHSKFLLGLNAETQYHFRIVCFSGSITQITGDQKFTTLRGSDQTAPDNVTDLEARYVSQEKKVILQWDNPLHDFSGVKVVRNEKYYSRDYLDGYPVCEGDVETCDDLILVEERKYYYTVFAYDSAGNFASGTGVSIYVGNMQQNYQDTATTSVAVNPILLTDVHFYQDGVLLRREDDVFVAKSGKAVEVTIDADKFLKSAKAANISVEGGGSSQTYIFKLDKKSGVYRATFIINVPNTYSFTILINELGGGSSQIVGRIKFEPVSSQVGGNFTLSVIDEVLPDLLLLIVIALIIALIIRRRKKRKKSGHYSEVEEQ